MINKEYKLAPTELKAYEDWVATIPKKKYKKINFKEWIMFGGMNTGGGIGLPVQVRREYENGDVLIGDITDYSLW